MGLQFVLVHGAWHNGSAWDQVVHFLQKDGHTTYAPTLLGCGPSVVRRSYPLQEIVQDLVDNIVRRGFNNFVLVAHSVGGPVIQHVAQLIPRKVRRLVFVSAMVLRHGDNFLETVHEDFRNALIVTSPPETGDPSLMLAFDIFREMFSNTVDLETSRNIYKQLSPQGSQSFAENQDLEAFFELRIPRSYVHLTTDTSRMLEQGYHPTFSSRLGIFRLVEMQGDHESMYTAPELLAKKLEEAGRD
ncbi:hypothetical protein Mapa_002689 [Marchantia paleacea]|nr:hypothetical protein Mapa_002689 [Marchantia paleacea]